MVIFAVLAVATWPRELLEADWHDTRAVRRAQAARSAVQALTALNTRMCALPRQFAPPPAG
ncbi:hypothetical protein ABZ595_04880 [Streptomyces rubradiris]|uniref:hypothetical protein n=1 Tax=Streptomyces rubradiris TaxID=285531 RepID=UPI0033E890E5